MTMNYGGAIVVSWGGPKAGVDPAKGLGALAGALGFYDQMQKEGRITGYRVYSTASGTFGGMLVIEGQVQELAKLLVDSENQKHRALGSAVVDNLDVQLYVGGSADDVTQFVLTGMQAIQEAGINS